MIDIQKDDIQKDRYTESQIYRKVDIRKDRYSKIYVDIQKDRID